MGQNNTAHQRNMNPSDFKMKLWIYTNYDCNLRCSYCVAESSPRAHRRAIEYAKTQKIVDQAIELGFENIYFTGGEPFILNDIYKMLAYSAAQVPTTVLSNAMLFRGKRLQQLKEIKSKNLTVQVSLDGSCPEHHDPYRGDGSWQKTMDGIRTLQEHHFNLRISTTETPANSAYLGEISAFRRSLGIADEDHFIRPLAKRGFSTEGLDVSKKSLIPELTINTDGIYWHPLSTDPDMLVSREVFPLAKAVEYVQTEFAEISAANAMDMREFQ